MLYELAADLAGPRHAVQVNVVGEIRQLVVVRVPPSAATDPMKTSGKFRRAR